MNQQTLASFGATAESDQSDSDLFPFEDYGPTSRRPIPAAELEMLVSDDAGNAIDRRRIPDSGLSVSDLTDWPYRHDERERPDRNAAFREMVAQALANDRAADDLTESMNHDSSSDGEHSAENDEVTESENMSENTDSNGDAPIINHPDGEQIRERLEGLLSLGGPTCGACHRMHMDDRPDEAEYCPDTVHIFVNVGERTLAEWSEKRCPYHAADFDASDYDAEVIATHELAEDEQEYHRGSRRYVVQRIDPIGDPEESEPFAIETGERWEIVEDSEKAEKAGSIVIEHEDDYTAEIWRRPPDMHEKSSLNFLTPERAGSGKWDVEYVDPNGTRRDGSGTFHDTPQAAFDELAPHITEVRAERRERAAQEAEMERTEWPEQIGRFSLQQHTASDKGATYEAGYLAGKTALGADYRTKKYTIRFYRDTRAYHTHNGEQYARKKSAIEATCEELEEQTAKMDEIEENAVSENDFADHHIPPRLKESAPESDESDGIDRGRGVATDGGQFVPASSETSLLGIPVTVKEPMTRYEMQQDLERAENLLDELEGYPVDRIVAYGSQGRIGVYAKPGHDPLYNGIIVANIDGFRVDAIRPKDNETVYIRFQDSEVYERQEEIRREQEQSDEVDRGEGIRTDGGRPELLEWVHPNEAPEDALDGRQFHALKQGVKAAIENGDGPNLLDAPGNLSRHHWNHAGIGVSLYMHRSGVVVIESSEDWIVTDADTLDHVSTAIAAFQVDPGPASVASNEVTEKGIDRGDGIRTDGGKPVPQVGDVLTFQYIQGEPSPYWVDGGTGEVVDIEGDGYGSTVTIEQADGTRKTKELGGGCVSYRIEESADAGIDRGRGIRTDGGQDCDEPRMTQLSYAPYKVSLELHEGELRPDGHSDLIDAPWEDRETYWCHGCGTEFESEAAAIEHATSDTIKTDGGAIAGPEPADLDDLPENETIHLITGITRLLHSPDVIEGETSGSGKTMSVEVQGKSYRLDTEKILSGESEFRKGRYFEIYTPGRLIQNQRSNHSPGSQTGASKISDPDELPNPNYWPAIERPDEAPTDCPNCGQEGARYKDEGKPRCEHCGDLVTDESARTAPSDDGPDKWDLDQYGRGTELLLDKKEGRFMVVDHQRLIGGNPVALDVVDENGNLYRLKKISLGETYFDIRDAVLKGGVIKEASAGPAVRNVANFDDIRDFEVIGEDQDRLEKWIRSKFQDDDDDIDRGRGPVTDGGQEIGPFDDEEIGRIKHHSRKGNMGSLLRTIGADTRMRMPQHFAEIGIVEPADMVEHYDEHGEFTDVEAIGPKTSERIEAAVPIMRDALDLPEPETIEKGDRVRHGEHGAGNLICFDGDDTAIVDFVTEGKEWVKLDAIELAPLDTEPAELREGETRDDDMGHAARNAEQLRMLEELEENEPVTDGGQAIESTESTQDPPEMPNVDELEKGDCIRFATEAPALGEEIAEPIDGEVIAIDRNSANGEILGPYEHTSVRVLTEDGRYRLSQYQKEDGYGQVKVAREVGIDRINHGHADMLVRVETDGGEALPQDPATEEIYVNCAGCHEEIGFRELKYLRRGMGWCVGCAIERGFATEKDAKRGC